MRIDTGNKQKELTTTTALIIEIANFLYLQTTQNDYKTFVSSKLSKLIDLIQQIDLNEASFISSKEFEPALLLNYKIIKSIHTFDSSFLAKHHQKMFEVQNFALTKIKTISCQCGHSSLLGILKILNLPSFTLD